MPPFLLSVALLGQFTAKTFILFGILHFLVYPASNGYNSYFDRDKGSIGGLSAPPPVSTLLVLFVQFFDILAIFFTVLFIPKCLPGILAFIVASRLYSYYGVRIKALPWLSFIMVGAFQGAMVFCLVYQTMLPMESFPYANAFIIFLYLLASYPVTQAYQIEEDLSRGDKTIASILGIGGSLLLTGALFLIYQCLCIWLPIPRVTVLILSGLPVIGLFCWGCYHYVKFKQIGYSFVRALILLNWLSAIVYFAHGILFGNIFWASI
jgi:1,4-dihydroxy-2-naphthoate octaprenyltransferase